jgi:hypothetical protein
VSAARVSNRLPGCGVLLTKEEVRDVIFAALAMLVLAAVALPMAIIALSRPAQKTSAVDGEPGSPTTAANEQLGSDQAAVL